MSQNISNSATSNVSPTQNQMSMQNRMPQSQLGTLPQQPSWSAGYYGQPNPSPYMTPYMPHGAGAMPNHASSMSQPPLSSIGQKPPSNPSDRTRAAYPPHANLYSQPLSTGGAPGGYYGYDSYYNQDPYLTHSSSTGATHWSSSNPNNSMMAANATGSLPPPPLRPQTGTGGMLSQSQNASAALPPLSTRPPPPPQSSQTPERNQPPEHMMSSYDRQRGANLAQQSQHPSAILSQNVPSSGASTLSPTQHQMSMQGRMQSQGQMTPMNQPPSWSSSYYGHSSQSPYMSPYMPHGGAGSISGHSSSMTQPPSGQMSSKPPTNGSDRPTTYPPHSSIYGQPPPPPGASSSYYSYDQSYGQMPTELYPQSSQAPSHWPTPPGGGMLSSGPGPAGSIQAQLRPQTSLGGQNLQSQGSSTALTQLGSRPTVPSQTPERSPSISTSYPSPNQQGSAPKSGSNSLAQLEQMVMPGSGQTQGSTKSPTQRSTTSSPSTNTVQPASVQYPYNPNGQSSYFGPGPTQTQSGYYPSYEPSDNVDPVKTSWSDGNSNSVMNAGPPGTGMDPTTSYGQSYEGTTAYGDYTQLSTPSQTRFPVSSDISIDQGQVDKTDPYAIDSQTFEDNDDPSVSTKAKKPRVKKGDESGKKERRQRAPRAPKGSTPVVAAPKSQQSPTTNSATHIGTPTRSVPNTPEVQQTALDVHDSSITSDKPQHASLKSVDDATDPGAMTTVDTEHEASIKTDSLSSTVSPIKNFASVNKSPQHQSEGVAAGVNEQSRVQYAYNAPPPPTYPYNSGPAVNHSTYYPPYGSTSNLDTQKSSWVEQSSMITMDANTSSTMAYSNNASTIPSMGLDQGSNSYNHYAQLSTPSQGEMVDPEAAETIATAIDSKVDADNNDLNTIQKTKKSRSKKGDGSVKRERKPRPSRAHKSGSSNQQLAGTTTNDSQTQPCDEGTQPLQDTECTEEPSDPVSEAGISEERPEAQTIAKPKRSRSKKSGDKPKRPSRAVQKPEVSDAQIGQSDLVPPITETDQSSMAANESVEDEQDATATDTTPAKPKRIRIRDSGSKGKKKLPKFALKFAKTKKRKRLGSSDNEQSDLEKTPPPSPDEDESGVQKRRSARNTKKLKYNDDIELGFSESDDDSPTRSRKKSAPANSDGDLLDESAVAEEPTVFAAPVEDTMVVEKIMSSRMGKRELEPEPGEVLPLDGTFIDIEEFYVKYKNMSYLHCDWRTLEELERGDRRVTQKIKRFKQKKDNANLFSFMDEELFDPQYCEVDRILAVNEVEEMLLASDDDEEIVGSSNPTEELITEKPLEVESSNAHAPTRVGASCTESNDDDKSELKESQEVKIPTEIEIVESKSSVDQPMAEKNSLDCLTFEQKAALPNLDTISDKIEDTKDQVQSSFELESKRDENLERDAKPRRMKKKVSRHYLVKWRSLTYEDSTWELEEHLDPEKIRHFERFKDPPPKSKWKAVKRPKPEDWVRKEISPVYKNNNTLREYQLEGINWLSFCWHQGRNCILADEMGLGKTIQSIAFINEIYEKGIYGPFLVIVPLSTVGNWAREFETWTDLNVITYHGGSTSREMLKEYEMFYRNEQGNRITQVYKFQVMITTFEIILSDCLDLMKIPWRCCIIDEAHRLKNKNCKLLEGLRLLNMEHRVLLTGTPLQNNVEELFSLLNFLEPTQFASTEQFLQEFGDLKTEAQVDKLKLILKPMMLRRLKEDVEKTLAPKEETIVEVELTNIQKKYYRAILERNFSFLQKGGTNNNMPNLMNTMMELRKCCIHPYLINGAEEQILYEARETKLADGVTMSSHQAMVNASGKLVLLDKLLPRLKADGHRVLIFSQMVRCLDILEDYVTHKQYPYERIDGRVRGSDRQQAIDRYSKPGSDRFIFLLCTRAGGLGINLTAADTVIIFDSDWNPQNDLQAQARCHRIGQSKAVKIYRLICRNTYEREMFDKASLKLGLDKAVLQSMNTQKASGLDGQLTKKEIEELLRKGAYGALMDDDNAGDKFCEEDIDQILQRRTQVITIESTEAKGSTFSKATFSSSNNREDIELDDPDFWEKWAKKANIDPEDLLSKEELVQLAPRRRTQTKRYGADGNLIEMSDLESSDEDEETISMRTRGSRRGTSKSTPTSASKRSKRHKFLDDDEDELMANIDGGYWSKSDCLKIESGLLTYGWGRWDEIIANNRFKREITVEDCENICRVILLYCLNSYKGDEKIKSFVWELILPPGETTSVESETNSNLSSRGRKPKSAPIVIKKTVAEEIAESQWPKEAQNDPLIALPDDQYRRHLQRNCNRLLIRVRFLHYLKHDILKGYDDKILSNCDVSEIEMPPIPHDGEIPVYWWDDEADKSLLVGTFKHGHDNFNLIRQDPNLCFLKRCGPPTKLDLNEELDKTVDYDEVDTRLHINLKKTAAGACLHELLNNVVRELKEESSQADKSDEIIDENKNSILKCNDTRDSIENLCENGINESSQTKMDITDDDSLYALNESSTDNNVGEPMINGCTPSSVSHGSGLLPFPTANELNQRFRRLITTYQKISKKLEIQLAQKVRDELKKERTSKFEAAKNEREERKRSQAQKWSRREESDFVKAISFFGVEYDSKLKRHDWNKFRLIGKLDKKMDETLEDYYKAFTIMCKKATLQPLTEDEENYSMNIEAIPQDRASRCLSKIDFFNKIRINVIKHPQLDKRLKKCQPQSDLPDWWKDGLHDKDLLLAVAKHGLYRLDYNLAHDSELIFESVIREKVEELFINPPPSILIPLDQLQELLERNGVEYSKDIELDDESEIIKVAINSLIDKVEQEEYADSTPGSRGKTRSGLSRSSLRKGANTVVKSAESNTSSTCIRLTSFGDARNFDHRVAEVTPVMPNKIPQDLKRLHEAGEVSVTMESDSVLLKLDDKPPIVLLGASNPIVVKIRWPKDKAIQTRLENLIHLVENNEWPNSSKSTVPTITLPGHLASGSTTTAATTPQRVSDDTSDGILPIDSPGLDLGPASSRSSRHESKESPIIDAPITRGRRGKGRRPKQPETDFYNQEFETPPKEDRQAAAKLRNLLSQGTSSSRTSTPEKSSKFPNNDKQSPNLSSLLASFRTKKGEGSGSTRTRDEKRAESVEATIPSTTNLLPQILANMKPEYRDLLNNPEAASLLMNTLSSFPGLGNLTANLRQPISTPSTHIPTDTSTSSSRIASKSYRSDRSSSRTSSDKQPNAGLSSLLATFKQQKPSSLPTRRDERNLLEQALPGASNLLPQIMANIGPQFRDLLNNPDAASLLMNSLGGLTGTNFTNLRPTGPEANTPAIDNLLQSTRSSSKGPPPAHQRSDNVPAAHDSSTRELRRSSQSTRDSSSAVKSTRSRGSVPDIGAQTIPQLKTDESSSRSSSNKRRGRPSSTLNENQPASAVDILDLSSLQQSRKGSSLLRSESRARRSRDITEDIPTVSTRSSGTSSRSINKLSSRHQEQDHTEDIEQSTSRTEAKQEQQTEKSGRSTRASKRIGSRIDALALNLQAKRLNVSDSPEPSPNPSRETSHDNQMLAHGSKSLTSEKLQSPKAPPAAHSGAHKTSTSSEHHRSRDKDKHNTSSSSAAALGLPTSSGMSSSSSNRTQDTLAQLMAQVAPQATSIATSLSGQSNVANQPRQDPLAQLMSNPLLAGMNPTALGGGTGDLMNQLLRKAGSNDFVKNLINEFVKNPNLASMDPNILASLAASMPMSSQGLPNFSLPTTASTSMPFGNFTNPMANPFLPFNMANLGMNNPLTNPLGMFPNLYMPANFPQQPQQQQQQPQSRQQPNQSSGSSDGGPKDKKMRYSRK